MSMKATFKPCASVRIDVIRKGINNRYLFFIGIATLALRGIDIIVQHQGLDEPIFGPIGPIVLGNQLFFKYKRLEFWRPKKAAKKRR